MTAERATKNWEGFPCYWCGKITTLLDMERFHVCEEHQQEQISLSHVAMKAKYPKSGTDERNPEYFADFRARSRSGAGNILHG